MAEPETTGSQSTPAGNNGWNYAIGGALAAGVVVGFVMFLVDRNNVAACKSQIELRDKQLLLFTEKLREAMTTNAIQAAELEKLRPKTPATTQATTGL